MLEILGIVAPVFLVVMLGYAASRFGAVSESEVDTMLRFTTRFAVTALLFRASATLDMRQALDPAMLTAYYLPAFAVFALGIVVARRVFAQRPGEAVASGFTALFANSLFLGLPIIERAYGAQALPVALAIIAIHAPAMYLAGIVTMESAARDGAGIVAGLGKVGRSLGRNPMVMSVAAGLAWNTAGLPLPAAAEEAMRLLAGAALPLGMFGIGATLTRYRFGGDLLETGFFAALSLVVRPLMVAALAFWVFDLDPLVAKVTIIMGAMPGGINIYLFAAMYKRSEALAANVVLVGTVAAIVTSTLWLAVLG
jgi:predicted permease